MKRLAIYARVSTDQQTVEPQLHALREYAARRAWGPVEYVDAGVSGAKDRRPALDQLLADCRKRHVDAVAVVRLDRLARSVRHLVTLAAELEALGIDLIATEQNLDTSTPVGRFGTSQGDAPGTAADRRPRDRTIGAREGLVGGCSGPGAGRFKDGHPDRFPNPLSRRRLLGLSRANATSDLPGIAPAPALNPSVLLGVGGFLGSQKGLASAQHHMSSSFPFRTARKRHDAIWGAAKVSKDAPPEKARSGERASRRWVESCWVGRGVSNGCL